VSNPRARLPQRIGGQGMDSGLRACGKGLLGGSWV
ncbi:hypothetical protein AK812_SmicGene47074, partial [Symbiodinium microadriaticum]